MSLSCITAGLIVALMAAPPAALEAPGAPLSSPPRLQLDDPLEAFVAKNTRTEAEIDRLHAAALFATARTLERRGEPAAALAKYQRAFRYDPQTRAIVREIIPLALSLGREDEVVRYAPFAARRQAAEPELLFFLAQYLAEQGEWKRSLDLYESLLASQKNFEEWQGGNIVSTVIINMEMGRLYFLEQDFDRASAAFSSVQAALEAEDQDGLDEELRTKLLGDAAITYRLFAECHLEAGRYDEAERAFQQAHAIGKVSPGIVQHNLARLAAKRDDPQLALEKLQVYFDEKLTSEGISPYELLVELLEGLADEDAKADAADERIEQLYESDRDNVALGYFYADRLLKGGEFDRAKAVYDHVVKTLTGADAGEKTSSLVLAHRGLITIYHEARDAQSLYDTLSAAVASTGSLDLVEEAATRVAGDAELLAELDEIGESRWQTDPEQAAGSEPLALAQLAALANDYELSGKYYDRAIEKLPGRAAELTLAWGLELFLADRYEEAFSVFALGIDSELLPKDNPIYHGLQAEALELSGKTDEALTLARRAAEMGQESVRMAVRIPWIQYHAGRYDDAIEGYGQLIEKFGDKYDSANDRDALRLARFSLSNLYVIKGDLATAEEVLEKVLDEFPENIGAMNDLGYLWVDQNKRLEVSLAMIEKAVASEPENRAYLDSLGWAFYRLGRFEEAATELEKAAEGGDEHNGVILDHLGDAYERLDRAGDAERVWNRAAVSYEQDSENEKAEQARKKIEKLAEAPTTKIDDEPPGNVD